MVEVRRIYDEGLIQDTMTHPRVYPWIVDDLCPSNPSEYIPVLNKYKYFLGCFGDDGEYFGLFFFNTVNSATVEAHACMLPKAWGLRTLDCAKASLDWIWDNTGFNRVVTSIPAYNRLAYQFAQKAGMTEYGVNPKGWMRDGALYDLHLLGLTRAEV